nr:hypothetical protein [Jeotgalibacillus malaysiensis]
MNVQMGISCECGNTENVSLKRITEEHDGRIYYEALAIEDTFENSTQFRVSQTQPDETTLICLHCSKTQSISL